MGAELLLSGGMSVAGGHVASGFGFGYVGIDCAGPLFVGGLCCGGHGVVGGGEYGGFFGRSVGSVKRRCGLVCYVQGREHGLLCW